MPLIDRVARRLITTTKLRPQPRTAQIRYTPLKSEYLTPKSKTLHHFEMEAIADHQNPARKILGMPRRAYVAQIIGVDEKGYFVRKFLKGMRDYSRANSVGSRGIYISFHLLEGPIYEISEPTSWHKDDRYFIRIENRLRQRMSANEVMNALTS